MASMPKTETLDDFLAAHEPIRPLTALRPGEMCGKWRVTAFLGRGGSSEVYRVVNEDISAAAALKLCVRRADRDDASDEALCRRFRQEAEILAANMHSAFPRFHEFGIWKGRPGYVMELLEPRPLPNTDGSVAEFLIRISNGVSHLHSLGFIHRDIKPANIMWRIWKNTSENATYEEPVLTDLGLAKEVEGTAFFAGESLSIVDGKSHAVGTPRYAAPEQLCGGEVSAVTDVYALGMLVNECFGGSPPRAWVRIVRRATAAIPEQRYGSVKAFSAAVRWRHGRKYALWAAFALSALVAAVAVCMKHGDAQSTPVKGRALPVVRQNEPRHQAFEMLGDDVVTNVVRVRCEVREEESQRKKRMAALIKNRGMMPTNRALVPSRFELIKTVSTNEVHVKLVRLDGRTLKFENPVKLQAEHEYWIEGPGVIDGDLSGPDGSRIRLKNCVLLNRTTSLYPENGLRYELDDGAYLNFIQVPECPAGMNWHDFIDELSHARNTHIRFGGPLSIAELTEEDVQEAYRRLECDARAP